MDLVRFVPYWFEDKEIGILARTSKHILFSGNRLCKEEDLPRAFPDLNFCRLKQVHSARIFGLHGREECSSLRQQEGDGLITQTAGIALTVVTADCLPILLWNSTTGTAVALHAGWRGIAENIVARASEQLQRLGDKGNSLMAWIGPHIKRESFEVGNAVAHQLEAVARKSESVVFPHKDSSKKYIDLFEIARGQLVEAGVSWIGTDPRDTFLDSGLCSFRRDHENAGRMYHFVARVAE